MSDDIDLTTLNADAVAIYNDMRVLLNAKPFVPSMGAMIEVISSVVAELAGTREGAAQMINRITFAIVTTASSKLSTKFEGGAPQPDGKPVATPPAPQPQPQPQTVNLSSDEMRAILAVAGELNACLHGSRFHVAIHALCQVIMQTICQCLDHRAQADQLVDTISFNIKKLLENNWDANQMNKLANTQHVGCA